MHLEAAFETLYRPRNLRSASICTIRLWHIALRLFSRFLGRPARLGDLTDETLSAFASWRLQTVLPPTVNRDLASLLALWRWLHTKGLVDRWPDVQLEQEPRRVPVAWTQEEFSRLMAASRKTRGFVGQNLASSWWPAALLVLFDSGERVGALLRLRWVDVDLTGRWVVFRAEHRKGRDQDNAVRIAPDTAESVAKLCRTSAEVFHWPHTHGYLWKRLGRILETAGLPNDRRRKFHCVRRTTASHFEAAGGNATDLLKHASRRNTLAYLDPRILRPVQAVDRLWRPG
jgi:integrase